MAVKVDHEIEVTLGGDAAVQRHDELPHADAALPVPVDAEAGVGRVARVHARASAVFCTCVSGSASAR